jgi:RNA polymerase sigma factor (sigma-70 family)
LDITKLKDLFPVSRRGGNIPVETMSEPDNQLIAEFNARRSEEAFAALVRQHVNLVFATALRQVGDAGAAEEITQNVFVALAQAAGKLGSHPTIAGWLHQTALNKSREWLRSELRRRRREQVAVNLELAGAEGDSVWSPLVPLLDEALLELREPDRLAVILHFMEGRTFHEVGSVLGIGEDTARKRVNRCLEQLTHFFRRHGFAAPALVAGAPLFTLSSHAAPAGLAASAATAGLAAAHSAATSTLTLIKGALKIMAWTSKAKTVASGVGVLLVLGTTTGIVLQLNIPHRLALAEGRRDIANHIAEPLELTAQYDTPASKFGKELSVVPRGFQTFDHVPLQIDGSKCLWGAGYAKYGGSIGAENLLGIPMHRKFETLYVYHTAMFWTSNNTPVYELVFRYEDDYSVTNIIRYGVDILDSYSNQGKTVIGPTGPNSRLAWYGENSADRKTPRLRYFLTAVNNPKPFLEVASIDLYSCKSPCCGIILAMTPGRSGLMR